MAILYSYKMYEKVTARTFSQRNSSLDLLVSLDLKACELRDFQYLNSQLTTKLLSCCFSPPKEYRLMADLVLHIILEGPLAP